MDFWSFIVLGVISFVLLTSASAAMSLSNLIHCALCLVLSFVCIACIYLWLGVEFLGFVQVLVYVGAVSILVVFTILLTRRGFEGEIIDFSGTVLLGPVLILPVLLTLWWAVGSLPTPPDHIKTPVAHVAQIGIELGGNESGGGHYILPMLGVGILLTAALIGGASMASSKRRKEEKWN